MNSLENFGKWRSRLWPIHSFELKKLIPLFLMKFFISLNYGILASLKDTLVVTEKGSGAEVIPVLKGWIVLPCAIIATLIYSKLSNHFKRSTLFYGIFLFFLTFLLLFAFVLYPYRDSISPHKSADFLLNIFGQKSEHWIAVYRHWSLSLFFVIAELWGGVVIFLLFWGFANEISNIFEAKRFYTLFSAGGNLAALSTGPLIWHCTKKFANLPFSNTLQQLIIYAIFFGIVTIALHFWLRKYVLSRETRYNPQVSKREEKTKLSLLQGIKYVAKSKYLLLITVLVIAYGMIINMVEISWKATLKLSFPNPSDYQSVMGTVTSSVGLLSFLTSVFIGGGIIRSFGWRFSALIPPITVGVSGIVFLFLLQHQSHLGFMTSLFGVSPLILIVLFGAFQNVASKTVKYCFFDTTKEMAFIPLDQESKIKGKAAIDVVGSRLGKSGAAWVQIFLIELAGTGSVLSITNLLIPIIGVAFVLWIFSVNALSKKFHAETTKPKDPEPTKVLEEEAKEEEALLTT